MKRWILLLLFFCVPVDVSASIAYVSASSCNNVDNTGSVSSSSCTPGTAPAVGSTLVVQFQTDGGTEPPTVSSVTDGTNTYPLVSASTLTSNGTGADTQLRIYAILSLPSGGAAAGSAITVNFTSGPKSTLVVSNYTGVNQFGLSMRNGSSAGTTTPGTTIVSQYAGNVQVGWFHMSNGLSVSGCATGVCTGTTIRYGSGTSGSYNGGAVTAVSADNLESSSQTAFQAGIVITSAEWGEASIELSTGAVNIYQYVFGSGSSSPSTTSFIGSSFANDIIIADAQAVSVLGAGTNSGAGITFADGTNSGGGNYTQIKPGGTNPWCNLSLGTTRNIGMSYTLVSTANSFGNVYTVTATATGSTFVEGPVIAEINGLNVTTPLDTTSTCTDTNTVTGLTTTSVTPVKSNELLFGTFSTSAGQASFNPETSPLAFYLISNVGVDPRNALESAYVAGTSGSYTAQICPTACGSTEWAGFATSWIAAIQPVAVSSVLGGAIKNSGKSVVH